MSIAQLAQACLAGGDKKACTKLHLYAWVLPVLEEQLSHLIGEKALVIPTRPPGEPVDLDAIQRVIHHREVLSAIDVSRVKVAGDPSPQPNLWSPTLRLGAIEAMQEALLRVQQHLESDAAAIRQTMLPKA